MTKLRHLSPLLLKTSRQQYLWLRPMSKACSENESSDTPQQPNGKEPRRPVFTPESPLSLDDIDEPTNCCMSGCANCVWIEYAERLSAALKGSQSDVQKLIMSKVQDPNMRAFLAMELRVRKLIE